MPPERLRCKIKPADLLTRRGVNLVPAMGGIVIADFRLPIADCLWIHY